MRFLALAALPAMLAAPAMAGNLAPVAIEPEPIIVTQPAPVAPAFDWTGGYVGGQLSYGDVRPDDGLDTDLDGDGLLYGLRAGYDYDFGPALLGGFLQYDRAGDIELGATGLEVDDVLRAGVRVGTTFGRNLVYGTGGYAQVGTDGTGGGIGSADGYFLGAGYEAFVAPRLSVGIEALHHEFDEFDDAPSIDARATTVGLNLNFRF